nr:hypothetical protein [Tanacetum cinerariifolium]
MKAQEDEGNMDEGWDITVKNVDRFRKILTPTIHTLPNLEPIVQSYVTRRPVHDKEKVVREKDHDYDIPLQDHVIPYRTLETVCMMGIPEGIHKMKAQEDEGNMDEGWDNTVNNVDRFRKILTPTIHTLPNLEPIVQSYVTRRPVHDKEKVVREKDHDYDIPLQDHQGIRILGLLNPLSCGKKVMSRRNHIGYAVTDIIT